MERYAVVELQLNPNGAIGNLVTDHGTDKAAALSHYHMALASAPASILVATTVILQTFYDDRYGGTQAETINGTGVLAE